MVQERGERFYCHFHPDEHRFVDQVSEWIARATQHEVKLTSFLDPRQAFIVHSLVNRSVDVHVRLDGGHPNAERKRAWIAPDYRALEHEEMAVVLIDVAVHDPKGASLAHGDYLGAVLGIGLKREKIGDLYVHEQGCQLLVAQEIADFVRMQLQQVHRFVVTTSIVPLTHLRIPEQKRSEQTLSVASLRLDGIVSDVYHLSRSKVLQPIKAGRCKVNWKQEENPGKLVQVGDIISLQGYGRFEVLELEGETKKGRTRLKIGKYV